MDNTTRSSQRGGTVIAWAALAIAVIALILAWNVRTTDTSQTGSPTSPAPEGTTLQEEFGFQRDLAIARLRLIALRARLAVDNNYEEAREEAADIRRGLDRSAANASEATRDGWEATKQAFDRLDDQLSKKSADALGTLEQMIRSLRRGLETED